MPKPELAIENALLRERPTVVMIGGWSGIGIPNRLVRMLVELVRARPGARLEIVHVGADPEIDALFATGCVTKLITSFALGSPKTTNFVDWAHSDSAVVELMSQGTLAERIRAAAFGVGPFYLETEPDSPFDVGKEVREFSGRPFVLEHPLKGDLGLIAASTADEQRNLHYYGSSMNFNPLMAAACSTSIAEVSRIAASPIPPSQVQTPGIVISELVSNEA